MGGDEVVMQEQNFVSEVGKYFSTAKLNAAVDFVLSLEFPRCFKMFKIM